MSSERFEPNTPITREQMATIIARYVQSTGKALPTITDPVTLRDMNAVSDWARDGVELMRTTGIIASMSRVTCPRRTCHARSRHGFHGGGSEPALANTIIKRSDQRRPGGIADLPKFSHVKYDRRHCDRQRLSAIGVCASVR